MQSTNVRQIKAALVEQAFHGTTQVSCPLGSVVAESRVERAPTGDDPGMASLVCCRGVCIEGVGVALRQEGTRHWPPVLPVHVSTGHP